MDGMEQSVTVRPVVPQDWCAITKLFGEKGACGGCWCMSWRVPRGGKLWEQSKGEPNRRSLRKLVLSGEQHAIMAFADGEPVGWCSFGPRAVFPRLERVKAFRREWQPGTWSIVCFYIHPRWRRRGVAQRLLEAATERAFALGAHEVEAYPVAWKKGPAPAAFAYTGVPSMFDVAEYELLSRPASTGRCFYLKRASHSTI
jgi:GNAT superfamily N-acetyltransferase